MVITHKIDMDLEGKEPAKWIEVSQWDAYTRQIRLSLFSHHKLWTIPEGAAVLIRYRKPDGKRGEYDTLPDGTAAWSAAGNELTLVLAPQVLTAAGPVMLHASILLEEKMLNTFAVEIRVREPSGKKGIGKPEKSEDYFYVTGVMPAPDQAEKGQYIRVAEVDAKGRVIRVEAVDIPAGGTVDTEELQRIIEEYLAENPPSASAPGKDGVSPTISVEGFTLSQITPEGISIIQSGYHVTITDANGEQKFDVLDGANGSDGKDGVSPVVSVSKSGKVTTIAITDAKGTHTATINDGEDGTGGETAPGYWQTELQEGVDAINAAMEAAGRNKSAFLWYSDAHWGYGSGVSPALLAYLQKHTAMTKVNFGGDIANDYEYPDTGKTDAEWMALMREWRLAVRGLTNHHSVIGNHDYDGTVAHLAEKNNLYGFLMAPEESADIVRGGDFYYYIDEPSEKTRYLYLNTSFCTSLSATGEEGQGQFVVDALKSTPDGWHVVVISHIWFLYADTATPTVGSIPTYCQKLLALFDAYNDKGSGSVTLNSAAISYDFAGAGGRVEFCIGGHTHVDYTFTSSGGIPVILTETDSYHTRGDSTRTAGTITEASVSGIVADYDASKISVVRIGRGESREVAITRHTVSYTNVLGEVGYTENMRLSASGGYAEVANTGTDLTGYIPVQDGDVIRLRNVTMPDADAYTNKVYFFDSSKTGVNSFSLLSTEADESLGVVYAGGNLAQFKVLGKHIGETSGGTGYIRIGAANIDSMSVITVNEEIG